MIASQIERRLAASSSTAEEWLALKLLADETAKNATELAREFGVTSGSVTRLIDMLEARGWVERERSKVDRRAFHLRLTPEGSNEVWKQAPIVVSAWNEILSVFAEDELKEFVRLLTLLKQDPQTLQSRQPEAAQ
jgi:DNA-binding MarR family transcriptional regulator